MAWLVALVMVGAAERPDELLSAVRTAYEALEFEAVIEPARALIDREDVSLETQLEARLLLGSALAVVGDAVKAESQFRFLLRGRPDFDMDARTSPKIVAIFRKAQAEERAIREQTRALERERTIASLKLDGELPTEAEGGRPVEVAFRLRDQRGVVDRVTLHYRREGETDFSALALKVDPTGTWRGDIPGDWTENEGGVVAEYWLATMDADGQQLVTRGGPEQPVSIAITPGSVADAAPFYEQWWFWSAAGAVVIAAVVTGWLLYDRASSVPDSPLGTHNR